MLNYNHRRRTTASVPRISYLCGIAHKHIYVVVVLNFISFLLEKAKNEKKRSDWLPFLFRDVYFDMLSLLLLLLCVAVPALGDDDDVFYMISPRSTCVSDEELKRRGSRGCRRQWQSQIDAASMTWFRLVFGVTFYWVELLCSPFTDFSRKLLNFDRKPQWTSIVHLQVKLSCYCLASGEGLRNCRLKIKSRFANQFLNQIPFLSWFPCSEISFLISGESKRQLRNL